jgi:polysaccharide biosynthesis/export protein
MNTHTKHYYVTFILCFMAPLLFPEVTSEEQEMLKQLPVDQRSIITGKIEKKNALTEDIEGVFNKEGFLVERPDLEDVDKENQCEECIFGYDIFRYSPSTFAPANIVPVSFSYILGPGDELSVNLYGTNKVSKTDFISRDGTFNLPTLGAVNLAGFTFAEAQNFLKKRIKQELVGTEISINLKKLRSITVYVLGQAHSPGAYTLSALSTVTNTLFLSGGANKLGSLRNIQIKRAGKLYKTYDLYDLLIKGDTSSDVRLEDGDTIFIPFIEDKITIGGAFKRPHVYELLKGETLEDVVSFAGGFKAEVGFNPVIEYSTINRVSNKREISNVIYDSGNLNTRILNGDAINVSEISGLRPFKVELTGEFNNPGVYSITRGDSVLDLVNKAGGYTGSAFVEGAVFLREEVAKIEKEGFVRSADELENVLFTALQNGNLELEAEALAPVYKIIDRLRTFEPIGRVVTSLDTLELKTDPYNNFELRDGDKIHIPKRPSSVSVVGEVLKATSIKFLPEYQLDDYLDFAGGLTEQADDQAIYVIGPDGQAELHKKRFLSRNAIQIMPGSTIVVTRTSKPLWDAIQITRIVAPIFADLATSAAAIAAINN